MFRVPGASQRLEILSSNRLAATTAALAELLVVVFLAIGLVIVLEELSVAERMMTNYASEVFRMPLLSKRFDKLLCDFIFAREAEMHLCEFAADQHDHYRENATKARKKR